MRELNDARYFVTLNYSKLSLMYLNMNFFFIQNPRKVIHMWAEKEMHNLSRMHKAGVPCPKVLKLKV